MTKELKPRTQPSKGKVKHPLHDTTGSSTNRPGDYFLLEDPLPVRKDEPSELKAE